MATNDERGDPLADVENAVQTFAERIAHASPSSVDQLAADIAAAGAILAADQLVRYLALRLHVAPEARAALLGFLARERAAELERERSRVRFGRVEP